MKFHIDYSAKKEDRLLTYDADEFGFNIEPKVQEIDFGITINSLDLTVVGDDRKVIEVLGFCGYGNWIKSNYIVPEYIEGSLKVIDELEGGAGSYAISKQELPINVNIQTGWVCIGNPEKKGNAVEFINNCVAVIDNEEEFISLWLKPQTLPNIE